MRHRLMPRCGARSSLGVLLLVLLPLQARAQEPTELEALDAATRAAVAAVAPSVVEVEALGGLDEAFEAPKSEEETTEGLLTKAGFKQAFGPSTGLVVSAEQGLILTTTLVLRRDPRHLIVTLDDGRSLVARPLGRDESRGLLLLQVQAKGLTAPRLAPAEDLQVGRWSIAVGRGLGMGLALSRGIVSALGRVGGRALQSSAAISPVNYGGPLVGIDGAVLGVLVPLTITGGMASVDIYDSGIGFAVPASDLAAIIPRLAKGDVLKAGFAGLVPDPGSRDGVRLTEVAPGSPAASAGLRPGDVVTALDGAPVATAWELRRALAKRFAGEAVAITYTRGTTTATATVTLGEPPVEAPPGPEGPHPGPPPPGQKPPEEQ